MTTDKYKNYKLFKTIQLTLLILFGIMSFCYLNFDSTLRSNIYSNKSLLTICIFLWVFMLYSITCIICDLQHLERTVIENYSLLRAAYSDLYDEENSRNSLELVFSKYNSANIAKCGLILIDISNSEGFSLANVTDEKNNSLIDFSRIIESISERYGVLGKNSASEYLLIMDNCSDKKLQNYSKEINDSLNLYNSKNSKGKIIITLDYVLNTNERVSTIVELLSKLYSKRNEDK